VGGYASGPAMAAALQLKIPTMAFEPNAMPGLANRLVGKKVQAAAVNFPSAAWFRNCEVTGIPVRPEFFALEPPSIGPTPPAGLWRIAGRAHLQYTICPRSFRHCSMRFPASRCCTRAASATPIRPRPPMPPAAPTRPLAGAGRFSTTCRRALPRRNLVMARSGASTVAELAAAGKPSLLVPFAASADEHQKRNAEAMVDAGAAAFLLEQDLKIPGKLLNTLTGLLTSPSNWPPWPKRPELRPIPPPPSAITGVHHHRRHGRRHRIHRHGRHRIRRRVRR
jgi:UDP-N-acetylglucosamine--N-acetylmuramyl-(pentapeptide) pyrophosphoryl-undecaprenol N-acetylglucosamine transferase